MALEIDDELRKFVNTELYAFHPVAESLRGRILNREDLPVGNAKDILVYHSSFGIPELTRLIRERTEKVVLAYHNITPADRYWNYSPDFAAALEWGRKELEVIRPQVVKAVADSNYNARELTQVGYTEVEVIPAGANPHRLRNTPIDVKFNRELTEHFPHGFVLFVSQSLPHKRVELAMAVAHLLQTVHRLNVGLVVAGPQRNTRYNNVLREFRTRLPGANVLATGEVTEEMLATLYRRALLLLGTSDHEGLGNPPLEAMAEGCPVVIRGCGAVPDTVGKGGIVLPCGAGVLELAEIAARVINSTELQRELKSRGRERLEEFFIETHRVTFSDVVRSVLR